VVIDTVLIAQCECLVLGIEHSLPQLHDLFLQVDRDTGFNDRSPDRPDAAFRAVARPDLIDVSSGVATQRASHWPTAYPSCAENKPK
jgi:hypothetical protein